MWSDVVLALSIVQLGQLQVLLCAHTGMPTCVPIAWRVCIMPVRRSCCCAAHPVQCTAGPLLPPSSTRLFAQCCCHSPHRHTLE
jgi:hypothetical protein